ncbi:MAG: hypothetical protein IJ939_03530 [Clostridia bacterium]|nr:hypothetical protein [Clostridia bacterium]
MIYKSLSQLKERHEEIMSSYKNNLPLHSKGSFWCIVRCVLFVLWCFIWLESGNRYLNLDYVYYDMASAKLIIVPLLIAVAGFFIFKPYKIWTERTYFGKIEKIEKQSAELIKKDENGVKVIIKRMHMVMYDGYNTLTIRKKNGRLAKKKVPNLATFDKLYDIDSSLSVINGLRFPAPMNKAVIPENMCLCTKCGSFESKERTRCSMCFTTLWYK